MYKLLIAILFNATALPVHASDIEANDFPQRVIYRLAPDGALLARIESMVAGKLKR